jgi:asparagine synthase (glutamine-hydrolysing)
MCGIAGSLSWKKSEEAHNVENMMDSLVHRGPDANGIWINKPIILGHRRLSILDVSSSANQPMIDDSGRFVIVFNGEIYNFAALRNTLEEQGFVFRTHSDTEIILAAWRKWNLDALQHLEGMFAFALWDIAEQKLVLARDRFGEKPLYYFIHSTNCIVFASELGALQKHPLCPKAISPRAISQFLSLNYILSDSCIIENIHKLPPAHVMTIQKDDLPVVRPYWSLSDQYKAPKWQMPEEKLSESFRSTLQSTVKDCSISDVPLGAFLSGGIDSSTIVASMAAEQRAKFVKTFTIGFEDDSYNELDKAQRVASYIDVDHHWEVASIDRLALLPKIVEATDEPFADTSMLPLYMLSALARKTVTVCLSGDGGDELFAGYETYRADILHKYFSKIPFKRTLEKCVNLLPVSLAKVSFDYKAKKFIKGLQLTPQRAHYLWRTISTDQDKSALVRKNYHHEVMEHDPFDIFEKFYEEVKDCHPVDQHLYVDAKTWLVDDILVKVDRMSMAHSLEVRAPFLNHKLAEWVIRLPIQMKIHNMRTKVLLKKSQERALPLDIIYNKKEGFNAPVSQWLGPSSMERMFDNPTFRDWFNEAQIQNMWKSHEDGRADHGLQLFGLLCLSMWMERLS